MNSQEKEIYLLTKRVIALEAQNKPVSNDLEKRVKVLEDARKRQIELNSELLKAIKKPVDKKDEELPSSWKKWLGL